MKKFCESLKEHAILKWKKNKVINKEQQES